MGDALAGPAIHQANVFLPKCFSREGVVVEIEAARQPPAAVQHERAYDRAGGIALLLENLGHRTEARVERLPGKILHAILKGISTRQDRGMRRPGQRHLRDGALEDNAVARQGVEGRGLHIGRAVAAEVVGANRVNGDENHVRATHDGAARPPARSESKTAASSKRQKLENVLQ